MVTSIVWALARLCSMETYMYLRIVIIASQKIFVKRLASELLSTFDRDVCTQKRERLDIHLAFITVANKA